MMRNHVAGLGPDRSRRLRRAVAGYVGGGFSCRAFVRVRTDDSQSARTGDVACPYRKSDSAIAVMKSAEDGRRYDAAHVLDGARNRSVFVERPMSPQLIIISGILRQNPA